MTNLEAGLFQARRGFESLRSSPSLKSERLNLAGAECTEQLLGSSDGLHWGQLSDRLADFLDRVHSSDLLRREYGVLPASKMYFRGQLINNERNGLFR